MTRIDPAYLEHERKRFMRPDAHRFLRPDWRRFVMPDSEVSALYAGYEQKYSPDQPRVPAGSREGGQWTSDGSTTRNDSRVLSDANPDNEAKPGARYAQNRPRGPAASVIINGQRIEPTPGQAARLTVVEAQAQDAIRRVQELDPSWRPTPSAYESVEGLISSYQGDARQAEERLDELRRVGIGPGPYAGESIPASSVGATTAEREEINRIGSVTGCNTCGTLDPGTVRGSFVPDHQPPTALNPSGSPQRLYPQCWSCSQRQGGYVKFLKAR